ncbi:MAG: hypothetical protein Q9202_006278 [Teloschistes flavicans]
MATTMGALSIDSVVSNFNIISSALSSLAVTIFLVGLALGPMFLSSMSEIYGRLPLYRAANIGCVAFIVGNALSLTLAHFMICRILSGCAGRIPLAIGGGTIADVPKFHRKTLASMPYDITVQKPGPRTIQAQCNSKVALSGEDGGISSR